MHESRRLAYLRAMGIDVWHPRAADAELRIAQPQEPDTTSEAANSTASTSSAQALAEAPAGPKAANTPGAAEQAPAPIASTPQAVPPDPAPPEIAPAPPGEEPPPWTDADLAGLMAADEGEHPDLPQALPPSEQPGQGEANPVASMDWPELEQAVAGCRACGLCERRTNTVFGVGDRNADVMFIGEGPGADEDRKGEPFVGRAGQLLNRMIAAAGFKREQVYIANIVKCRPPGNRDPAVDEAAACRAYLMRQIELVAPRLIVCLGRVPATNLLETTDSVGRLRGRLHSHQPTGTPLLVTYHPSYYLRSPEQKAKGWQDLQRMLELLQQTNAAET